ncbi:MAG: glycosyltransferase family 4 protein [Lyngbya sp.]|nr:glycosyltransferase family 4 protein [Lyngbya sp.]
MLGLNQGLNQGEISQNQGKISQTTLGESPKGTLLYLSVYDPHIPLSGAGTRGINFVENLTKFFKIDLIYLEGVGQKPDEEISKKYQSSLPGVRSKTPIKFTQFDYFVYSKSLYEEAVKKLEKTRYDWLLCDYGLSAIYGSLLSKRFQIPFVYCSHNIEYLLYWDKAKTDRRRLLLLPYVYWMERLGAKLSNILVAISQNDADYYRQNYVDRDQILVIPQGFDSATFNPFYQPPQNDPKVILFCGNYGIQQNREAITIVREQILEKVLANFPNVIFRFIGANPPENIKHPNIEFTGFVEDYPSELKRADVFISPLKQGRGFPTKIVESLACGKPTIATPVGARAIEGDYQSLLVCDLSEFPEKICQVLHMNNPVNLSDFEKLKQQYSWKHNIRTLGDKMKQIKSNLSYKGKIK